MQIQKKSVVPAIILSLVFFCVTSLAAQVADPAWKRAEHLKRGINTSMWFAQSPGNYSVEKLRTFTTPEDIALIQKLGFDHVRLSVDPVPVSAMLRSDNPPFLVELDRVVNLMLEHHLSVIIDLHPESSFKSPLFTSDEAVERYAVLWSHLAQHFATKDPEHVFFEIMNEPEQPDAYRWLGIEARISESIRAAAPQHTIIATGAHWSSTDDLLFTHPLALSNVIYTFHDYEPFPFTHQGAGWTDPRVQSLREVPYPSTPDAVEANLAQATSLPGQFFVEEYGLNRWNAERIERTIEFVSKWSTLHHVPAYCGEFGVLRDHATPTMRAAWLHDMRTALEKNHIGWAMWDYQENFGLVRKQNGTTTPDPLLVNALGLTASAN